MSERSRRIDNGIQKSLRRLQGDTHTIHVSIEEEGYNMIY
jgi:hypothetical protein